MKKANAQAHLQFCNVARHRWLGHVQGIGSLHKAAAVNHGGKRLHFEKFVHLL
jgi:hypothetical protein